jgi:diguanylate cyclase (GGDEF)-like protein
MRNLKQGDLNNDLSIFHSAFVNSSIGQVIICDNYRIMTANKKIIQNFSIPHEEVHGKRFGNAFHCFSTNQNKLLCGQSEKCNGCKIRIKLEEIFINNTTANRVNTFPYWYYIGNDFHCKWFNFNVEPLIYRGHKYALINLVDVTNYIRDKIQLRNKLKIDLATGALNKYSLMIKINKLLNRKENIKSFTVCMIDFDDFKIINDTYGHLAGDEVLEAFSNIVRSFVRKYDIFGRFGGEEFIFVFIDTDPDEVLRILRRIQQEFKAFLFEGMHKPLSFSCGLLYVDQEKTQFNDGTELVRYVDRLLYKAKETGKNRIVSDEGEYFFSSI